MFKKENMLCEIQKHFLNKVKILWKKRLTNLPTLEYKTSLLKDTTKSWKENYRLLKVIYTWQKISVQN